MNKIVLVFGLLFCWVSGLAWMIVHYSPVVGICLAVPGIIVFSIVMGDSL